jgi:hypothetical protein
MPQTFPTPPWWPQVALRAALPNDGVGDAIVGDLHEEFVQDAASLGASRARTLYWRRAGSIVVRAAFDELRLRSWARDAPSVELPPPAVSSAGAQPGGGRRLSTSARARMGADVGVGALALGVLGIGVVVNTVLFATVRGAPRPAMHAGPALTSAIGVGATVLALLCAGVAAVVLCAGPRWLRRRLRRTVPSCEE